MDEEGTVRDTRKEAVVEFPVEIVNEILLKLPVRSLLKFKRVCKLWNSIINSPEFIKKHLIGVHATPHNQHKKFLGLGIPSSIASSQCVLYEETSNGNIRVKRFDFPYQFPDAESDNQMVVSVSNYCDGLVCFNMHRHGILVWNPSFPIEYKNIRPPESIFKVSRIRRRTCTIAMGYDSTIDDYKIVNIPLSAAISVEYKEPEPYSILDAMLKRSGSCYVEVFSLKSNSWRKKKIPKNFGYGFQIVESDNGLYTGNRMHWMGRGKMSPDDIVYTELILYFDMVDESLGYVNLPSTHYGGMLLSYKDSIAVADHEGLWVLQDYCGMKSSWNKVLQIQSRWKVLTYNSCFTRNGDIVNQTVLGFLTYDIEDGDLKKTVLEGDDITSIEYKYSTYISTYVESLVSPRWWQ